jgi:methylated-DNA-[protein]-cysteine S-methyltransferase
VRYTYLDSPLGRLLVTRDDAGITGLYLPDGKHAKPVDPAWTPDDDAFTDVRAQLAEYFAGNRQDFDLPLHPSGSAFQLRVWQQLRSIPYGVTTSYGQLAAELDPPGFSRAVGSANGRNPISIIVPCHRVVGADGSLTGYGGGLPAKRWLLEHEAAHSGLFASQSL